MNKFDLSAFIELKKVKHCPKVGDHFILQNQKTGELIIKKVHLTTDSKVHQELQKKLTH